MFHSDKKAMKSEFPDILPESPPPSTLILQMAGKLKLFSSPSTLLSSQGCLITFISLNEVRNISKAVFTLNQLSDSCIAGIKQCNHILNWFTARAACLIPGLRIGDMRSFKIALFEMT